MLLFLNELLIHSFIAQLCMYWDGPGIVHWHAMQESSLPSSISIFRTWPTCISIVSMFCGEKSITVDKQKCKSTTYTQKQQYSNIKQQ